MSEATSDSSEVGTRSGEGWKWQRRAVILLIGLWCCLRFVNLSTAPPGFYIDESAGAAHVACLLETGKSADGETWPLYASGFAGGSYTPPYLYSALLWTKVFGTSRTAFRAHVAFFNVATLVAIFLGLRAVATSRAAWFATLAGALSPWSWQFSRVAWDPPLAPAFLAWGTVALLVGRTTLHRASSGSLFALAIYSYPPFRVTGPLWFIVLAFALTWSGRLKRRDLLVPAGTLFVVLLPLLARLTSPELINRSKALSIANTDFLDAHRGGTSRVVYFAQRLLGNLHAHLSPDFLLFRGDGNLRHSSQLTGQLSPLDILACLLALGFVLRLFLRGRGTNVDLHSGKDVEAFPRGVLAFSAMGAFLGTLPAILTWEGIPHALRAIGTWPFVAVITGLLLDGLSRSFRHISSLAVATSIAFTVAFLPPYFRVYETANSEWFQPEVVERLELSDEPLDSSLGALRDRYADLQLRYHLMQRGLGCEESQRAIDDLRSRR